MTVRNVFACLHHPEGAFSRVNGGGQSNRLGSRGTESRSAFSLSGCAISRGEFVIRGPNP